MKNIKIFFKKYWYNIVAFLFPIIVILVIYLFKGLFTKYDFLTSDMSDQFYPTYKYFKDVLVGNNTFPYTISKGLGGTMYGAFFYGLSSPTNFLIIFFDNIRLFILINTLVKIGLSGLTMYHLLYTQKNKKIYSLFFSFAYSLSTYTVIYSVNIMWLDAIWLAPLIIKGIDKILNEKKDWLYILTLLYALISNYYIGYMLVLFSVIYFIYKLYINSEKHFIKNNIKLIIHFFLINLFIGITIMFILLPIFIESRNYLRVITAKLINPNYLDLIAGTNIGFGYTTNPLNAFSILFYCGIVMLPLLVCYFSNKKISKKERKATFIVYLSFFLPIVFGPLSYIWHMFTYPAFFNFRYAFLMIIFTLTITIKMFDKLDINKKTLRLFFIIYLILEISLAYASNKVIAYYNYVKIPKIIITLVLLLIYCILIIKKKKKIILIILPLELIFNISIIYKESSYNKDFSSYEEQNKFINYVNDKSEYNNSNYRVEYTPDFTSNNSLYFNYKGISNFISSTNKNSLQAYNILLDINRYKENLVTYNKKNIIVDMLLGLKYIYSNYQTYPYELIETKTIGEKKGYYEKNKYALSLAYNVTDEVKNIKNIEVSNIEEINFLLSKIFNKKDNYFIELEVEKKDKKNYILHRDKNINNTEIYIMSKENIITNIDYKRIIYSDNYTIIETDNDKEIKITFAEESDTFKAYSLDLNKIYENKEKITQMNYKIHKDLNNYITGEIEIDNGIIMTTIPYEKGWTIYIDGKEIEYYKILNLFIGFDIDKGKHSIVFKYQTPGLKISIILSSIGLTLSIIYQLRLKKYLL